MTLKQHMGSGITKKSGSQKMLDGVPAFSDRLQAAFSFCMLFTLIDKTLRSASPDS